MATGRIPLVFCLISLICAPAICQDTKDWRLCVDQQDGVSFRYPSHWQHGAAYSDGTEFEGPDGMVQIIASEGTSPMNVCHGAATHKLRPFGQHPRIQALKVQGQAACVVWPSADQGAPHDAELVVAYPHPVTINGNVWPYLIVDADKNHMRAIIDTVRFIEPANK